MKHNANSLTRLWRSSRRAPPEKRVRRRPRLELERLDRRDVPAVVADYGVAGLMRYTPASGWTRLSNDNAEDLATAADGNIVAADFGARGLWLWTSGRGWSQLTTSNPQNIDVANNSTVVADLGTSGLWRWNPASGWLRLSTADVDDALVSDNGAYILGDFNRGGVQRYTVNSGAWRLITSLDASGIGVANDGASFVVGGGYLLRYADATGLQQFDRNASTSWISVTGDGCLYAGYANIFWNSVWRWTPTSRTTGTWRQLSFGITPFTGVNAGGGYDCYSAYVDYGSYGVEPSQGLWYWTTSTGWKRIGNTAEQIAVG